MSTTAWASIAIFAIAYAFNATEKIHRVTAALETPGAAGVAARRSCGSSVTPP